MKGLKVAPARVSTLTPNRALYPTAAAAVPAR